MSPGRTGLLAGTAVATTADLRHTDFPMALLGGYRTHEVEAFRRKALAEIEQLGRALEERARTEEELAREVYRLNQALELLNATAAPPAPEPHVPAQSASRVLTLANKNAERLVDDARADAVRIVGEARHAADQVLARAEQHAVQIHEAAVAEGEKERARIIEEASAEARRTASGFRMLCEEMGVSLQETAASLAKRAAEWDGRAKDAQSPPQASPPDGGPASRRTGSQRQASAKA